MRYHLILYFLLQLGSGGLVSLRSRNDLSSLGINYFAENSPRFEDASPRFDMEISPRFMDVSPRGKDGEPLLMDDDTSQLLNSLPPVFVSITSTYYYNFTDNLFFLSILKYLLTIICVFLFLVLN